MYDGKEKSTPVSNRGVVDTCPKSPIACVDWFSCTFSVSFREVYSERKGDKWLFKISNMG